MTQKLIDQTKDYLVKYKEMHPNSLTPMRDAAEATGAKHLSDFDKNRFYRAAKQLGYCVMVERDSYYESGIKVW